MILIKEKIENSLLTNLPDTAVFLIRFTPFAISKPNQNEILSLSQIKSEISLFLREIQ
jgi:hypothetical protein